MAEHLYEIVFAGVDSGREGFTVELTHEQMLEIKGRFEAGMKSGAVRDWSILDLNDDGIGYEEAIASLEAGREVKGDFRPADTSKAVYLVSMEYKSKLFGLKKIHGNSMIVWMTPKQAEFIENMLSRDDRVSDYQVVDLGVNISSDKFYEDLQDKGVW